MHGFAHQCDECNTDGNGSIKALIGVALTIIPSYWLRYCQDGRALTTVEIILWYSMLGVWIDHGGSDDCIPSSIYATVRLLYTLTLLCCGSDYAVLCCTYARSASERVFKFANV